MRTLELFIDPVCFCKDRAKMLIEKMLQDFPDILFKEINMVQESERAREVGAMMSPTIVLNGKIISVGLPEESQLKETLENVK